MSLTSRLWHDYDGDMMCFCPVCNEGNVISSFNFHQNLRNGEGEMIGEYEVTCCECGEDFYASSIY